MAEISPNPGKTPIQQFAINLKEYISIPDFTHRTLASLVILVPVIFLSLGAVFQIMLLSEIGMEYLSFFSTSRLFTDSLIFFINLGLGGLLSFIIGFSIYYLLEKIPNAEFTLVFNIKVNMESFAKIVIDFLFFVLGYLYLSIDLTKYFNFTVFAFTIFIVYEIRRAQKYFKFSKTVGMILLILMITGFIHLAFLQTRLSYITINNSKNFKRIHQSYEAKGVRDSLLYFNDQYIFLLIKKDTIVKKVDKNYTITYKVTNKEIEILRFENLFSSIATTQVTPSIKN